MSPHGPYSKADDSVLVRACQSGDAAAWEVLVHRYQRLIYAIPRRAGLDDDQCADVFQRTFALLFQHIGRLDQPERARAWLVTTARRETQRMYRRAGQFQPLAGDSTDAEEETSTTLVDSLPLPEETLLQLEEQHLVRTGLLRMDERCRQLITLLFYQPDPMPYEEVAVRVGVPIGSIGPTRARCLQKLRRALKDIGF